MTIPDRRLSTAEVQDLMRPLENDLVAFYRLVSDAAEALLDKAVREGWTPERLIDELDLMIGGDNRAAETTAIPALEDLRVNKSQEAAMPVPNPKSGESEQDFVSRVLPELVNSGKKQDQAAAIAYDTYRRANKSAGSTPPVAQRFIDAARSLGVDPVEFYAGIITESGEHDVSLFEGAKIALDHLRKEDPQYYTKLQAAGL